MKVGSMFKDIAASLVRKPVTERYPQVRRKAPDRLRGKLIWHPQKCTGCELCVKDCPAGALELLVLDKRAKRFVLGYYLDRCTFCAQCVQSCRHGCIELAADDWELAVLNKHAFILYFGEDDDVREAVERAAAPTVGQPANW